MASKKAKPADMGKLLASAAAVNVSNVPFYATKDEMAGLIAHASGQLVEFNEGMKDPTNANKIAFRATALGLQQNAAWTGNPVAGGAAPSGFTSTGSVAGSTAPVKVFKFDTGISIPAARRGGRGQNTYGFEQMEVGQSFYIGMSDENPNPSKRVASTVSSASKRMAPKQFIVRSVDETAQGRGKGARVWRTA